MYPIDSIATSAIHKFPIWFFQAEMMFVKRNSKAELCICIFVWGGGRGKVRESFDSRKNHVVLVVELEFETSLENSFLARDV
jgi:hypothetical protein